MRRVGGFLLCAFGLLALSGCGVYIKAVPIGHNTWVMESDGRGAVGSEIVLANTLRDAATLALNEGYSYFLLTEAPEGPTDIGFQAVLYGNTRSVTFAQDLAPTPPGVSPPVPADPTVRTRVSVIMLPDGDPRIPRAYSALKVLAGGR